MNENRLKFTQQKHLKLFLATIMFLCILLVTPVFVSAFEFDNIKEVKETNGLAGYNNIEVYNSWLIPNVIKGNKLWSGSLKSNTESCSNNCEFRIDISLDEEGSLVDDIMFETVLEDGNRIEQPIRSYRFYIKIGDEESSIDDYEFKCVDGEYNFKNNSYNQICNKVKVGSHLETEILWEEYIIGTIIPAGDYTLKLTGEKKPSRTVDWIIKSQGEWLEEWAEWGVSVVGNEGHGRPMGNLVAVTNERGYEITTNPNNGRNITMQNVTITATGITQCILYSAGLGATLQTAGVSNSECNFDYELEPSTVYVIRGWAGGGSYSRSVCSAGGCNPITASSHGNPFINFTAGYDGASRITGDFLNFANITFFQLSSEITLNSPEDNFVSQLLEVEFNATATMVSATLVNMSLYHNASGTFELNETKFVSGILNTTTFNVSFPDGNYLWNIEGCDSDGDCGFTESNRTFTIDTLGPSIIINLPIPLTDIGNLDINETLNWTIIESSIDTIWFDYNGTNTTLNGNVNETTFKLQPGLFSLTLYANDTGGNIDSSFVEWNYKIFQNSETFNASTFETASETYFINVTANSSLTAANLIFQGTTNTGTQSGNVWSATIDIPISIGTKSFNWSFTYAGQEITTIANNVTVENTNFSICGGDGGNVEFLNLSFKDETTLDPLNASIPASTFIYFLGSVNKSLTFSNSTNNFQYTFCATPNRSFFMDAFVQFKQGNAYPQRIFDASPTLTNVTSNQILYLLSINEGLFTTYATINSLTGEAVADVAVRVQKQIESIPTTVTQGLTDATGLTTLWLNPDDLHEFLFVKTGFNVNQFSIRPASPDTYQISMIPIETDEGISNGTQIVINLNYEILPSQLTLEPSTNYTFSFDVTRDAAPDSTSMTLRSNGTILFSDSQSGNGILTTLLNTSNLTGIDGTYKIFLDDEILTFTKSWTVINITSGDFSLNAWMNFGNELSFNSLWWNLFRYILIISTLLAVAGGFYYIDPFDSATASLSVAIIIIWFFGSFGWMAINTPLGTSIDNNIIPALFSITMIAFMIWRYKTQ